MSPRNKQGEAIDAVMALTQDMPDVERLLSPMANLARLPGSEARTWKAVEQVMKRLQDTRRLPVPTPQDLSEADTALRDLLTPPRATALPPDRVVRDADTGVFRETEEVVKEVTSAPEGKQAISDLASALQPVGKVLIPATLYWLLCHMYGLPLSPTGLTQNQAVIHVVVLSIVVTVILWLYRRNPRS